MIREKIKPTIPPATSPIPEKAPRAEGRLFWKPSGLGLVASGLGLRALGFGFGIWGMRLRVYEHQPGAPTEDEKRDTNQE